MINLCLFITMLIFSILSHIFYELNGQWLFSIYFVIFNFLLSFIIINNNRINVNLINLQSIFMLGFLVFFLGRFIGVIINYNYLNELFCLDFIFNYCSSNDDVRYLFLILNLILISFASAFLLNINPKKLRSSEVIFLSIKKTKILILFYLFFTIINIYQQFQSIIVAISNGYMALYANQADTYQTPFMMLFSVLSSTCLAFLYSVKDHVGKKKFYTLSIIYIFSLFFGIATGSRASFISGLILLVWLIFHNTKIKGYLYFILFAISGFLIGFINHLASFSGARPFEENINILNGIGENIYSQGITLMIFNSSLYVENYPLLGGIKTLIPGIQVIYPFFGVSNRYEFDWGSYVTYFENKAAYEAGFGLGWSIFSDFYILSLGFLPLFCFLIFLFGRLIVKITNSNSNYSNGLKLLMVISLFSINRGQISPLIFSFVVYTIICLLMGTLKVKRNA